MRHIRTWYKLLERTGLVANDSGPGLAPGTLTADVTWLPFFGPPFSELTVTGTLSPNATGDYLYTAINDSKPYYRLSSSYVLWWGSSDSYWFISTVLGTPGAAYWYRDNASPIGTFTPQGTATGTATITGNYSAPFDYKGVVIGPSASHITSLAATGFPTAAGSIEMLVRPYWNNADSLNHVHWYTGQGSARVFGLMKSSDNLTYLITDNTVRGTFTFAWTAHQLYHVVVNWGTNQLYINKVLVKTFTAGGLGLGATTLAIGDVLSGTNYAFNGIIYYFIARDVALTLAEITTFYNFFTNLYIPQPA